MITQYSTPTQNPYVPQPWDVIYQSQAQNQDLITRNEALRQKYGSENQALKEKYDMMKFEMETRKNEQAMSDMEETNMFLANIKAYGNDNGKLNQIRNSYIGRINDVVEKYGDNPYKLQASIRGLKMAVKQDVMGGELSRIHENYQKAKDLNDTIDKMRLSGYYKTDDYYIAQKNNIFDNIPKEPDLGQDALGYAKAIASNNPSITSQEDLTKMIFDNMWASNQQDVQIRMKAGRKKDDIAREYMSLAQSAAATQVEVPGKGGRGSRSGSNNVSIASPSLSIPQYKDKGLNSTYQPMYVPLPVDKLDDAKKYMEANAPSMMFYDMDGDKLVTGTALLEDETKNNKQPEVVVAGRLAPGTHRFDEITDDPLFASPYVVNVNGKRYLAQGPNDGTAGQARDVNKIFLAKFEKDKTREFRMSDGSSAKARVDKVGSDFVYSLSANGRLFQGETPDVAYRKYLLTKPR